MAFNKAREEYRWKQWKEAEERTMRDLGVSEEVIEKLRIQDWEDFKRERSYREHQFPNSDVVEASMETISRPEEVPVHTVPELLESIEDGQLFCFLRSMDKETLQIVLFRMLDIPTEEIAATLGITSNAIYLRINRLKEKMKKFMNQRKKTGD